MHINRRQLLGLGMLLAGASSWVVGKDIPGQASLFLSAAADAADGHWVYGFTLTQTNAEQVFKTALPARAHHIAVNAQYGFFVVVARRPGTWMVLADLHTGNVIRQIQVPANRHLFGHGVFSADGRFFYTTESDFADMQGDSGRVVVWEVTGEDGVATLTRMQEFPTFGVGPHELILLPDTQTLVVANGGIRTHPDHDRDNLNIDSMLPSLVYLNRYSGELLEQQFLPSQFQQASIRHLDVNADGMVVMAMQFEGEPFMEVPLLATHLRGQPLQLILAPPDVQVQMHQYVGSVRFSLDGRYFAAGCPLGNMVTFWDSHSGSMINSIRARDGCGVCATETGFVFSTGTGRVAHIDLASGTVTEHEAPEFNQLLWDNHLSSVAIELSA